jgi:hypothetical protein
MTLENLETVKYDIDILVDGCPQTVTCNQNKAQGVYSQNLIFLLTYEMAQ